MSALRDLQRTFHAHVLAMPRGASPMVDRIVDAGALDAAARLAIYSDGYRLRLVEALQTEFPALHAQLGSARFNRMARAYVERHPSPHRNLRWYGDAVPAFLAEHPTFARRPVLAEVATLEWTIALAFDAADTPVLALPAMATIAAQDWPAMRFTLHPSVHRLTLHWNAVQVWKAAGATATSAVGDRSGETAARLPRARRLSSAQPWLVWRQGLDPRVRRLEADAAWALDAVVAGRTFADVCEGLCRWVDAEHAALRAAALLKGWIVDGLLSGVSTAPTD